MSEWIYCKDRMPDIDGRYLVSNKISWRHVEICSLRGGRWDSEFIYAWMELPEGAEVTDE